MAPPRKRHARTPTPLVLGPDPRAMPGWNNEGPKQPQFNLGIKDLETGTISTNISDLFAAQPESAGGFKAKATPPSDGGGANIADLFNAQPDSAGDSFTTGSAPKPSGGGQMKISLGDEEEKSETTKSGSLTARADVARAKNTSLVSYWKDQSEHLKDKVSVLETALRDARNIITNLIWRYGEENLELDKFKDSPDFQSIDKLGKMYLKTSTMAQRILLDNFDLSQKLERTQEECRKLRRTVDVLQSNSSDAAPDRLVSTDTDALGPTSNSKPGVGLREPVSVERFQNKGESPSGHSRPFALGNLKGRQAEKTGLPGPQPPPGSETVKLGQVGSLGVFGGIYQPSDDLSADSDRYKTLVSTIHSLKLQVSSANGTVQRLEGRIQSMVDEKLDIVEKFSVEMERLRMMIPVP